MKTVDPHEISTEIKDLEFNNNKSWVGELKLKAAESRNNEAAYIETFTKLIEMEEAVELKRISAYNLENVLAKPMSIQEKTFRIYFDVSPLLGEGGELRNTL